MSRPRPANRLSHTQVESQNERAAVSNGALLCIGQAGRFVPAVPLFRTLECWRRALPTVQVSEEEWPTELFFANIIHTSDRWIKRAWAVLPQFSQRKSGARHSPDVTREKTATELGLGKSGDDHVPKLFQVNVVHL